MKQDYYNTFLQAMQLYDFKKESQKQYEFYVKDFLKFTKKPCEEVSLEDARAYMLYLIGERKLGNSAVNAHNSALKFFFENALEIPWNSRYIPRMKKVFKEPELLSQEQVQFFISSIPNLKYKAIVSTMYSSGLRVNETVHLKCKDIYLKDQKIRVEYGKNRRDRYAYLSKKNAELLVLYWRECGKPMEWLFPSRATGGPLTKGAVNYYLKEHARKLGWDEHKIHAHLFRHCFATHLLENGADVVTVQHLLGHRHLMSTERYVHLSSRLKAGLVHPFDQMEIGL